MFFKNGLVFLIVPLTRLPKFVHLFINTASVVVANEVTNVTISGTTQKDTTTVDGFGEKTLNVGNNKFSILTTAENGLTYSYEVNIYRSPDSVNMWRNYKNNKGRCVESRPDIELLQTLSE